MIIKHVVKCMQTEGQILQFVDRGHGNRTHTLCDDIIAGRARMAYYIMIRLEGEGCSQIITGEFGLGRLST